MGVAAFAGCGPADSAAHGARGEATNPADGVASAPATSGAASRTHASELPGDARPGAPSGQLLVALSDHDNDSDSDSDNDNDAEEHDRHRLALVDPSDGKVLPLNVVGTDSGSVYPVASMADGSAIILASRPGDRDPSRSNDRLGVVASTVLATALDACEGGGKGEDMCEPARIEARWLGPGGHTIRNPVLTPDGGFLVYEANPDSFRDLYRVSIRGGEAKRLTDAKEGNFEPTVSPDGMQVAFTSSRDGNPEIYRVPLFGGAARRLTEVEATDGAPVWSPSGDTIVFASRRDATRGKDLYRMRPDGGEAAPLVAKSRGSITAQHPVFSPDGKQLAYSELQGSGGAEVVVVEVLSGRELYRTGAPAGASAASKARAPVDDWPAWSSDGQWLFFSRGRGPESSMLMAAHPTTGESFEITDAEGILWMPRWRPS